MVGKKAGLLISHANVTKRVHSLKTAADAYMFLRTRSKLVDSDTSYKYTTRFQREISTISKYAYVYGANNGCNSELQ